MEKGEGKRKEGRKGNEKKVKRKEWKEGSFKNMVMVMGVLVLWLSFWFFVCLLICLLYIYNVVIINICDNLLYFVIVVVLWCYRINCL